jgi:hypothetical protein
MNRMRVPQLPENIGLPASGDPIIRPPPAANARIVAIYEYWRRIAPGTGVLPGRQHLDPVDIPTLLPNLWLVDVVGEPRRFRARLIGTTLQRSGIPLKPGVYVEDPIAPALREIVLADFRFVAETRQPVWFRGAPRAAHDTAIFDIERIFLPLAADGTTVDMLLNLTVFYESAGKEW